MKLTPDGWTQAYEAGRRLRSLLRSDDTLHFFTSPYRRTRETTEGILSTLTSDDPSPSPFPRQSIKVYEEPRLREQDFGNFQPCSVEMERMWQERADYGHFFYRIPNGESAADAYDRVSGFNESLWRQFGEDDCASVCVLGMPFIYCPSSRKRKKKLTGKVTHGLMSRVFLMKWYHFSVEYFEDLRNVNHCEFLIMRKSDDSGKYILENHLRTWSQLKADRLAAAKEKEKKLPSVSSPDTERDREKEKKLLDAAAHTSQSQTPIRRKWGGCPDGCDHGKHVYRRENSMHAMMQYGRPTPAHHISPVDTRPPARRRRWQNSSGDEDSDDPRVRRPGIMIDVPKSLADTVSSPDGTPSFISVEQRLRKISPSNGMLVSAGRDFGGSASGNTSMAGSDTEGEGRKGGGTEEKELRKKVVVRAGVESGMGRGAKADALGDQSDVGSDAGSEPDLDAAIGALQLEECSVQGSVY